MIRVLNILPQISRFFSAKKVQSRLYTATTYALVFLFIGIIAVNVTHTDRMNMSRELSFVIRTPLSPTAHFELASKFRSIQEEDLKEYELKLIQDLLGQNMKPDVLGESVDISKTMDSWNAEPKILEDKLSFWNTVIAKHPDYRDAYLQAAYIASTLHKDSLATSLKNKAVTLDPTLK